MYAWLHSFSKSRQSCIMVYASEISSSERAPASAISASDMPNSDLSTGWASSHGVRMRRRSRLGGASIVLVLVVEARRITEERDCFLALLVCLWRLEPALTAGIAADAVADICSM